jgi:limonene-1,2-epoxide hydrolase
MMHRGQIDGEVGVVALIPMGPCGGERLLAGMRLPGPRPSRAGLVRDGGDMAARAGALACESGEDLMTDVIDRLVVAMNAHDLDVVAGLIHDDYRSEQPAHPGRAFTGRAQMLANWEAMLAGIPDFRAEICRSVQDGEMTWTEWLWLGTRSDGQAFQMRGVTLFEVTGDQIVAGRLYMEDVERDVTGIEQAVEALSGRRPRPAQQ